MGRRINNAIREKGELREDLAVRFFDGGQPSWQIALSDSIPRLEGFNQAFQAISEKKNLEKTRVVTLLAP